MLACASCRRGAGSIPCRLLSHFKGFTMNTFLVILLAVLAIVIFPIKLLLIVAVIGALALYLNDKKKNRVGSGW